MKKTLMLSVSTLLLYSCTSKPTQITTALQRLPVAEIRSGMATTYQDYPATIEGAINVEIRPQIEGILSATLVDEGAYVIKGQPIFKIDDRPFRERYNDARAVQQAAEGALMTAELEVEKLTSLVENKVVSDFQLKTAKAALLVAKGNLAQAKAQVANAAINLGYTIIKAPVSGYIGRFPKKQGSLVASNDPEALTRISNVQNVRVYFSLGENDFVNFKSQYPGNSLTEKMSQLPPATLILADQSNYNIKGKIDMVDGQFNETTGAITLRATFPNPSALLRSGNTGKIRLSLYHPHVLKVPMEATIEMQDKVFVYAVDESNKVARSQITIIGKSGDNYLVSQGVRKGQHIVLSGIDRLQEGTIIQPVNAGNKVAEITNN